MNEHHLLVFLLSLAALLGVARVVGELARTIGLPLVVGEITAGILLGPTILGRASPDAEAWLFAKGPPQTMLSAYTTLAVVLLLVVAGLEVDLSVVRRRARSAAAASLLGIVFPMASGVALGFALPDGDLADPSKRLLFALFLGVALSISALPVIAKTLLDMGLFKTDLGLLIMTVAMVNDLTGWLAFSILLGPVQGGAIGWKPIAATVGLTLAFAAACMLVGRRAINHLLGRIEDGGSATRSGLHQSEREFAPGRVLSLVILLALLGAAATQAIGIHAVFGGFIVGLVVGDSPRLRERTRAVIREFVTNIFAPVFFASLGLRVDFLHAFDARVCLLVFVIAVFGKLAGCTLGARWGGLKWREAGAVGFGLNARGAMEIILALLALEAGLIREQLFVALVIMALATSLISGPMMKLLLYKPEARDDVLALLRRGAVTLRLSSETPVRAIEELVASLATPLGALEATARACVIERELTASTGLGDEIAIPHAAVPGLDKPLLALGRAPHGIDFDAPDGRPARIVFLLLMPPKAYEREITILASIAGAVFDLRARNELMSAADEAAILAVLGANAKRVAGLMRTSAPSFVNI